MRLLHSLKDGLSAVGDQRIFLIDDDITSLKFMGLVLRKFSREVVTFTDPAQAVANLHIDPPGIVVTDLVMPSMSGFTVMEEVRRCCPNTAIILLTGQSEVESAVEAIRRGACDYITKPVTPSRLQSAIAIAEEVRRKSLARAGGTDPFESELLALQSQLRHLNDSAQRALISALDARERETKQHSVRVSLYASHLAQRLNLAFPRIEEIRAGALLHDIGKIGIPDSILHKPGPLEDEEWAVMRRHPEIGYMIVQGLIGDGEGAQIVLNHHEQYIGGGYPEGLKGDQIPLGARLFAIVDAYDALTSRRPYRNAVSHWEAMNEIIRGTKTHFDPELLNTFLQVPEERWSEMARNAESIVSQSDTGVAGSKLPTDIARAAGLTA